MGIINITNVLFSKVATEALVVSFAKRLLPLVPVFGLIACQTTVEPVTSNLLKSSKARSATLSEISFTADQKVSEVALIDAADVNSDGIDDFVIGLMIDPVAQLGIPCCEVPRARLGEIQSLPAYLVLSGPNGYQVNAIPDSHSHRTWAGKFFELAGITYFYLGRNGEIGLPEENVGEKSVLYRVVEQDGNVSFARVWQASQPTVTSSISTYVLEDTAYILENNYGSDSILSAPRTPYDTVMYRVNASGSLSGVNLPNRLKDRSTDNSLQMADYNGDGRVDLLAAAEVQKSLDGKQLQSAWPGSYVVSDFFNKKLILPLLPPAFGTDHAGMAIATLGTGADVVIVEASTGFYGHQGGGFEGLALRSYLHSDELTPIAIHGELNSRRGNFRDIHKVFIAGADRLVPGYYSGAPQMLSLANESYVEVSNIPIRNFDTGYASAILPLNMPDCTAFATTSVFPNSNSISVKISSCMR